VAQAEKKLSGFMRTARRLLNRRIIPALLLVILFNVCFLPIMSEIDREADSYNRQVLREYTEQAAMDLSNEMDKELELLTVAADILGGQSPLEGENAQTALRAMAGRGGVSELWLVLPGGRVYTGGGEVFQTSGALDFPAEARRAPSISVLRHSEQDNGQPFICLCAPVIAGGQVQGLLYGALELSVLHARYAPASQKQVQLFVIDGETGDFLLDTYHSSMGNLYTDGTPDFLTESNEQFQAFLRELRENSSGYQEFRLSPRQELFSSYHAPVGINRWMLLLTVHKDYLFQMTMRIRNMMYILLVAELLLFLAYFAWVMAKNYMQSTGRERQLEQMAVQLDIQQTLFNAHQDHTRIDQALEKAAHALTAETVFLITFSQFSGQDVYVWSSSDLRERRSFELEALRRELPKEARTVEEGGSVLLDFRRKSLRPPREEREALRRQGVRSLMMIPIRNTEHTMLGMLGSVNTTQKWTSTDFLAGIAHNFMMALENISSYRIIEEMGTMDALTGLRNRNSYQRALREQSDILGCVYLDANGLHELNNQLGHAAGDAMLKAVGAALREHFPVQDVYRIGGDEFVVLCRGGSREAAQEGVDLCCRQIEEQGYHISAGLAWQKGAQPIKALITDAEHEMYEAKRRYYESLGGEFARQAR